MTPRPEGSQAFYVDTGLRFACRRCSACCRVQPGFVFLSHNDLSELLAELGVPWDEFKGRYLRSVNIGKFIHLSLREKDNFDCVFWESGNCRVYEKRPLQCRSFPFWSHLLVSRETWQEHGKQCPGIDEGPVHDAREIATWLNARLSNHLIELDDADLASLREDDIRLRPD